MKLLGAESFQEATEEYHPFFFWKLNVQYCVHKGLPLHFILSQANLVHTPHLTLLINFNITIQSRPKASTSDLLPSEFLTKIFHKISNLPMLATCPAHLSILDFYQHNNSWCKKTYEIHHYTTFSGLLLLPFSQVQTLSQVPCSQIFLIYFIISSTPIQKIGSIIRQSCPLLKYEQLSTTP